jgi:protein PhnA
MPNAANPYPLRWFDQGKRTNSARFHRVQHAALGDNRGVIRRRSHQPTPFPHKTRQLPQHKLLSPPASASKAHNATGPQGEKEERASRLFRSRKHHMDIKVRDSNGAQLAEGDSVTLIKDLKLKGSSTVLKRGTVIRNIHLTDDPDEIEGRTDKVKGLVLRTEFLKKA